MTGVFYIILTKVRKTGYTEKRLAQANNEGRAEYEKEKNKGNRYPDENFISNQYSNYFTVCRYGHKFLSTDKRRADRHGR